MTWNTTTQHCTLTNLQDISVNVLIPIVSTQVEQNPDALSLPFVNRFVI